jgi:hypothetical protein
MTTIDSTSGISAASIQGMDLETALMAVQSNRANLLETQLKDQIASVQAKNDQIAKLNQALGAMNKAAALFPSDAKADARFDSVSDFGGVGIQAEREANSALVTAGITKPGLSTNTADGGGLTTGSARYADGGLRGDVTKGKLDGFIQQLKSQIDAQSNSQQMDMLRLQSLSNKRNEAFETMTNFIKKMQDNRSSIVGNMR